MLSPAKKKKFLSALELSMWRRKGLFELNCVLDLIILHFVVFVVKTLIMPIQ